MTGKSDNKKYKEPEDIITAAHYGQLDLVKAHLEDGIDPNTVDEIGTSALHNAAKGGHWDIARLLLEKNASPRIEDGNRATPLRLAIRAGHLEIVRLLLECDPPTNETDETKLSSPSSLLRLAAGFGHTEIVQKFLDYNTPTLTSNGNPTALQYAAMKGHHDVCELLLKYDKTLNRSLWTQMVGPSLEVYSKDYDGNTPFAHAVDKAHVRTVDVFLLSYPELRKTCDRYNEPHFHKAIRRGMVEVVRIFLNHGADTEMKDDQGRRALHVAISAENMGFTDGIPAIIQLLLAHGAQVDAKDKYGSTAEFYSNNPKTRMVLRNHASAQSKGDAVPKAPLVTPPPPEYKA